VRLEELVGHSVTYQVSGAVASITMDDGKANALTLDMFRSLYDALDRAEMDGAGIVLAGRRDRFSAVFDLKVLSGFGPDALNLVRAGCLPPTPRSRRGSSISWCPRTSFSTRRIARPSIS
jgi:enoyl-CoA hydratase/carnithine racemase